MRFCSCSTEGACVYNSFVLLSAESLIYFLLLMLCRKGNPEILLLIRFSCLGNRLFILCMVYCLITCLVTGYSFPSPGPFLLFPAMVFTPHFDYLAGNKVYCMF